MGHGSSSCQLRPAELKVTRPRLPVRKPVTDVMVTKDAVQDCVVYVGRGSFHHGLSTTKWKSPLTPGHNWTRYWA